MTDQEMIDLLSGIEVRTEIVIGVKCFDGSVSAIQGKYMGNLEQYGFYRDGSWGLCKTDTKSTPCYRFDFERFGTRRMIVTLGIGLDIDYIKIAE